jgi:hypothetical protein
MRVLKYTVIVSLLFIGSTCTLFKKNISKPVTIAFTDTLINPVMNSSALNTKYINSIQSADLANAFMKGFRSEGSATQNVSLRFTEEDADFILKLKSFSISETSKTEKIDDAKSPHNGQEVLLNSVECSAEFELVSVKNKTQTHRCFNSKVRSEKLKNNRDAGDLIFGTNKDHSQYRTKLLADNICTNLSEDVGRRIWVPITRKIARNL